MYEILQHRFGASTTTRALSMRVQWPALMLRGIAKIGALRITVLVHIRDVQLSQFGQLAHFKYNQGVVLQIPEN